VIASHWIVAPTLNRADVVALGESEETVHVCGLEPPRLLATHATVLSLGGDRLALCTPTGGLVVVAAAWERHGVCAYDAQTGERRWQRKDLKRAHKLSPAGDGGLVAVGRESRALQVLDATTGASVARLRQADALWHSRHGPIAAVGWYRQLAAVDTSDWRRAWTAPVGGFAVTGVAFAPDGLLASVAVDPDRDGDVPHMYAFDLDGALLWTHRLDVDMACWALAWDEGADQWVGLAHNVNRTTPDFLVRWGRDGRQLAALPLPPVTAAAFVPGGRVLVTGEHAVDATSGAAVPLPTPTRQRVTSPQRR
jgi:outer membrane protein assembly factor BamB